jgi:hypothetical protein
MSGMGRRDFITLFGGAAAARPLSVRAGAAGAMFCGRKATLKSNSTISLTGPARRGTVRIGATNLLIARKVDPRLPRSTERPREPRGGEREKPRGSPRVSYGRRRAKLRGPSPSTEARVEGLFRRRRLPATTNVTHGSEQIDDQETDYRPHCFWRAHCSHRGHLCCRRCSSMVESRRSPPLQCPWSLQSAW